MLLKRSIQPFTAEIPPFVLMKRFITIEYDLLGKPASRKGEQNGEETYRCRRPRNRRLDRIP